MSDAGNVALICSAEGLRIEIETISAAELTDLLAEYHDMGLEEHYDIVRSEMLRRGLIETGEKV